MLNPLWFVDTVMTEGTARLQLETEKKKINEFAGQRLKVCARGKPVDLLPGDWKPWEGCAGSSLLSV